MRKQEALQEALNLLYRIYNDNFKIDDWTKREVTELFENHEGFRFYDSGSEETPEFKLFDEIDSSTGIDWWDENRERVNTVVRLVNAWQTEHRFDEYKAKVILAHIDLLRREYPEHESRGLTDWQHKILDDIESFVRNKIEED